MTKSRTPSCIASSPDTAIGAGVHAVEISFDRDRGMRLQLRSVECWLYGQAGPLRPRRRKWAHVTNSQPVGSTQASPSSSWGVSSRPHRQGPSRVWGVRVSPWCLRGVGVSWEKLELGRWVAGRTGWAAAALSSGAALGPLTHLARVVGP